MENNNTVTDVHELLQRIATAAGKLNAAAEEATTKIEELEEQLVEADPGVVVWGETLLAEKTTFQRDEASPVEAAQRVVTLGFAKVKKKKWGIVVREEYKGKRDAVLQEDVTPLRKAERMLRFLSLPHLTNLAERIAEELEAKVATIESAQAEEEASTEAANSEPPPSFDAASVSAHA